MQSYPYKAWLAGWPMDSPDVPVTVLGRTGAGDQIIRFDRADKGRDIPKGTVTDCSGFYLFTEKEED